MRKKFEMGPSMIMKDVEGMKIIKGGVGKIGSCAASSGSAWILNA